jgi:hypothetical protein
MHGLAAIFAQVDDREPAMPEQDLPTRIAPEGITIGSAVR